ncbi:MAG TPA: type 2 isopentenyl-diphosphate Delta-isomerase [Bdellovibrionales bacterium]|nr:type 2 isopentenyl-diphosphate Delta-isomerase [Bdellovibrionales bacterium]
MSSDLEKNSFLQFENRKVDHIHLSLDSNNQTSEFSEFSQIELIHEALPDLNLEDVDITSTGLNLDFKTPFLISSMTAGHVRGVDLNLRFARAAEARGWLMGVGSQRRELTDPEAKSEWKRLREVAPRVQLLGNIGISQLIQTSTKEVEDLVGSLEACGMIVHLNALQEGLQPEGTPQFRGGFDRLQDLAETLSVPVIVKETGCGFSENTLKRLSQTKVRAVDVSGLGGTHWGRIEGGRSQKGDLLQKASESFQDWGISTVESVFTAVSLKPPFEVWASGGVRSGLDAAKMLAMGSSMVGFAKPLLEAGLESEESLFQTMRRFEYELKLALFCTNSKNLEELKLKKVWKWKKSEPTI